MAKLIQKKDFQVMKPLTIKKVIAESHKAKTIFFNEPIECEPGQFIMLWLPGIDEKPFSLSYAGKNPAVTFEIKGKYTKALAKLKKGARLSYRGPFGKPYKISKGKTCVIAGGLGFASVAALIERLKNPVVIYGAQKKGLLIFKNRFKNINICTDDGSIGFKGFTTQCFEKLLKQGKKFDMVYTCGPEIMMKRVLDICIKHKTLLQASLERFMYCGVGLCGSCVCNGKLVCKDGPVFNHKELSQMKDFGRYALLKSGRKASVGEYVRFRT